MRNFTLLLLALFAVSTSVSAQTGTSQTALKRLLGKRAVELKKDCKDVLKAGANGTSTPIYKPSHVVGYEYSDGEWVLSATADMTYDKNGNMLSHVQHEDDSYSKVVFTYNSDNMMTYAVSSESTDGETYEDYAKSSYTYDSKVKDCVTEALNYLLEDSEWSLIDGYDTYKREITRDANGNVTCVKLSTYESGAFVLEEQIDVTYGQDGKASTIKFMGLDEDDDENTTISETATVTNIAWVATDGQLISTDMYDYFKGANRVKSGDITYSGVKLGSLNVVYDAKGGYESTATINMNGQAKSVSKLTYTDDNGSYTYEELSYEGADNELMDSEKYVYEYDSHGNQTLIESIVSGEKTYGYKTNYTYDSTNSYPVEAVISNYSIATGEYELNYKEVNSDIHDVTPVELVPADEADAPQTVYTTSGVRVGESLNRLPKGLYFVKKGAKTTKVLRR